MVFQKRISYIKSSNNIKEIDSILFLVFLGVVDIPSLYEEGIIGVVVIM
jgi:hypothetical protein